MLNKGVNSIAEIARALGVKYKDAQNDVEWWKAQTKPWLYGLAANGFALNCRIGTETLRRLQRDAEEMLEELKKDKNSTVFDKLQVMDRIVKYTIARIDLEGKGPVLMAVRKVIRGEYTEKDFEEKKD